MYRERGTDFYFIFFGPGDLSRGISGPRKSPSSQVHLLDIYGVFQGTLPGYCL